MKHLQANLKTKKHRPNISTLVTGQTINMISASTESRIGCFICPAKGTLKKHAVIQTCRALTQALLYPCSNVNNSASQADLSVLIVLLY